jgi:hypothetical protein
MAKIKINNEDKYVFRRYLSENPHHYEDIEMDGRTVAALAQSYLSVKNKDTKYVKFTDGAVISNDLFDQKILGRPELIKSTEEIPLGHA